MSAKDGAENQDTEDTSAAPDVPVDVQDNGAEPVESDPSDVVETPDALVLRLASQVQALEARLRTVSAAYKEQQDEPEARRHESRHRSLAGCVDRSGTAVNAC